MPAYKQIKLGSILGIMKIHPFSEIVAYPIISETVYQNTALYQMGRLEITKMTQE